LNGQDTALPPPLQTPIPAPLVEVVIHRPPTNLVNHRVVHVTLNRQGRPLTAGVQPVQDIVEDLVERDAAHKASFRRTQKGQIWVLNWPSVTLVGIVLIAVYLCRDFLAMMHYLLASSKSFNEFSACAQAIDRLIADVPAHEPLINRREGNKAQNSPTTLPFSSMSTFSAAG
jgi:hypothetical protein